MKKITVTVGQLLINDWGNLCWIVYEPEHPNSKYVIEFLDGRDGGFKRYVHKSAIEKWLENYNDYRSKNNL